jgi:citrate lyase beta subunit
MRARRALLYSPGDDWHKLEKAAGLGADCVCLDLEDGVALNRKEAAREVIARALRELDFGRSERLVRMNSLHSGLAEADLDAVLPAAPDAVVVPKVDTAEPLEWVSRRLDEAGLADTAIIALVESPLAVVNLPLICAASPRLQALIFGAEDLCVGLGATRTPQALELLYAREAVALHGAAFGLQTIDMVCTDFTHPEVMEQEARQGAEMGFTGKQVIHPRQIEPAHQAFTPGDEAIARARRLVEAFQLHQSAGKGAFALDGRMVDMPVIKAAERLLERARAGGKYVPQ